MPEFLAETIAATSSALTRCVGQTTDVQSASGQTFAAWSSTLVAAGLTRSATEAEG
jgi:hypothetical protein